MSSGKKRSISYASSSQMALSKKGRAFGDLKVLHSFPNKNVAKGHTVKNPFSSLTIEVDTEACGSFRDLKDQIIDRIGFGKSILFLLDGHILEENADVKGADPKSVQFALRDDLAPTLTAIQNAKRVIREGNKFVCYQSSEENDPFFYTSIFARYNFERLFVHVDRISHSFRMYLV